ncbi:MAG: DUF2510 domain-containing protein, partial [Acidimicrobiia bacterium]|nr:DUF2510 domain-containing protein [Acidimicrobiia bacterium]
YHGVMAEAGWYPDPHNPRQQRYWNGYDLDIVGGQVQGFGGADVVLLVAAGVVAHDHLAHLALVDGQTGIHPGGGRRGPRDNGLLRTSMRASDGPAAGGATVRRPARRFLYSGLTRRMTQRAARPHDGRENRDQR